MKIAPIFFTLLISLATTTTSHSMKPNFNIEDHLNDKVTFQSADGKEFTCTVAAASHSKILKELMGDTGIENVIPLPNIDGTTLEKTVTLLEALEDFKNLYKKLNSLRAQEKMLTNDQIATKRIKKFLKTFNESSITTIKGLLLASNYLDISELMLPIALSFGKWLMTETWELTNPIFNDIPKALKQYIISNLFKYAHLAIPKYVIICKKLSNALIQGIKEDKELTFEQFLTCIKLVKREITSEEINRLKDEKYLISLSIGNEVQRSLSTKDIFLCAEYGPVFLLEFYCATSNHKELKKIT